jgi:TPR repeat protein
MRAFLLIATSLAALPLAPGHGRAEARNPYAVAVIIGNKTYQSHDIPEVKYADRDAEAIKRYVIDVLGYDENNIIYVENATQGNFNTIFGTANAPQGKLARWLRPDNESDVLVYYSGHGVPGLGDGQQYLLPVDADPNTVSQNGFSVQTLYDNLQSLGAHSVTVLLDACFSGASAGGALFTGSVVTRPISAARTGGLTVLTAAQADQIANWDDRHKHGLFTEYFLEAVYGRADDEKYGGHHDGKITLAAVQKYLDKEMSYVARRENPRLQNATVSGDPGLVLASLTPDAPPLRHEDLAPTPAPVQAPLAVPPPASSAAPAPVGNADSLERQGEAALARDDYPAALGLFLHAATFGQTEAMNNIGLLYEVGLGTPKDEAEAMRWFRKAADAGNTTALVYVGNMYKFGEGVPADPAEARRWFTKAGDAGNLLAIDALLGMIRQPLSPTVDISQTDEEALKLSGSDRGSVQQWLTALGHDTGGNDGVFGPATRAAIAAYERAIGVPASGYLNRDVLARLRREGPARREAVDKSAPAPAPSPTPAAPAPRADEAERQGEAAFERKDYSSAMELFRQAAAAGQAKAMTNIGFLYANGRGVPQNYAEAMRWYRQAADNGSVVAINNIGFLYDNGYGVARDFVEALRWYHQAADKGSAMAMTNIGTHYKNGQGLPINLAEARRWYSKAAALGDEQASGELFRLGHPAPSAFLQP